MSENLRFTAWELGMTDRQIGEALGLRRQSIQSWREKNGLSENWSHLTPAEKHIIAPNVIKNSARRTVRGPKHLQKLVALKKQMLGVDTLGAPKPHAFRL